MSNHFLIPVIENNKLSHYVDTESNYTFKESKIPHKDAKHGLCNKLNRLVLRNDGHPPKVFKSQEKLNSSEPKMPKRIHVPYTDKYKVNKNYTFNQLEIDEAKKILRQNYKKDKIAEHIAIRIGAPRDACQGLIYKLDTVEKVVRVKKRISKKEKGGKKNVKATSIKTVKRRK